MHELKYLARPVGVEPPGPGASASSNRDDFGGLDRFRGSWELSDGRKGKLPGSKARASPCAFPSPTRSGSRSGFRRRSATEWAPAGHEVAWEQFRFLARAPARTRARGRVAEWEGFEDLILGPPRLQLWRAATDNDGLRLMLGRPAGPLPRWLELGLDRGVPEDVEHRQVFRRLDDGGLLVENEVELPPELRDLPRVGVVLTLRPGLERLEWEGLGPWENYVDRQASALFGCWRSKVTEEYVPYVMPQEHGHKGEVRRLTITDEHGRGVEVVGRPAFGFTASHLTADDLWQARHTCDLEPRAETILSLDHAQRGLGTASCGPDAGERYRLLEPSYRFAFVLRRL